MTKTIEWYEDAFLEFHLTAGKKSCIRFHFPIVLRLEEKLPSQVDDQQNIWRAAELIRLAMSFNLYLKNFTKMGMKKRIYQ